jgi:hypothetical protein
LGLKFRFAILACNFDLQIWLAILACDFGLLFWLAISQCDFGLQFRNEIVNIFLQRDCDLRFCGVKVQKSYLRNCCLKWVASVCLVWFG